MHPSVFLIVHVDAFNSYILAQFEIYLDFELIKLFMLVFLTSEMTSVDFQRYADAFLRRWNVIPDGDVGLRVANFDLR